MLCSSILQLISCAVVCFVLKYNEQVKYFPNKRQFTSKAIALKAFFLTTICCVCLLPHHFGCFYFLTWHKRLVFSQQVYWWEWTDMTDFLCRWEPRPRVLTVILCITWSKECHQFLQIYPCPWDYELWGRCLAALKFHVPPSGTPEVHPLVGDLGNKMALVNYWFYFYKTLLVANWHYVGEENHRIIE